NRRDFLRAAGVAAAVAGIAPLTGLAAEKTPASATKLAGSTPETLVKVLYDTLSDKQKKEICFDWDYVETAAPGPRGRARGLLRTFVANNWQITPHSLISHK